MRTIYPSRTSEKKFGPTFQFEVATAGEALRALHANFPGEFIDLLRQGYYQIIRGRRHGGMHLELDHLNEFRLGSADLHIVPVAKGSASGKGTGTAKAIVGIAIVGAAIFFSGGTLAAPLGMMSATIPRHRPVLWRKRTSGTNAKWKGETEPSEASEPTFGQLEIGVHEINTYVDISNQLLADSGFARAVFEANAPSATRLAA